MNCYHLVRYILRVKHTHGKAILTKWYRIKESGVSASTGTEHGYIYYLDFSGLEYHRAHTETPAFYQFSATLRHFK